MRKTTTLKFTKTALQNIKHHDPEVIKDADGKIIKIKKVPKKYFATNAPGVCMFVYPKPSLLKALYAHWSVAKLVKDKNGNIKHKRSARYKYLGHLNEKPLQIFIDEVNANLKDWKKLSTTSSDNTVGALVKSFIEHGADGYRVKTKGKKVKYRAKTADSYKRLLKTYVLLQTKKESIKKLMLDAIKFNGAGFVTGALKDVPLDKLTRRDIEIFHTRLESKPTTANRAVAAISVAIEWDMKRAAKSLYKGDFNPCLKITKYQETKDKNFLDIGKVLQVRSYCINEQWRDPHFLTFYVVCLEIGEREADIMGLVWDKPKTPREIESCRGWIDWNKKQIHLTDSKDRKPADVPLTEECLQMLQQLKKYKIERAAWAAKSKWVFPRVNDTTQHINYSSYRVKLKHFNFKFNLATRELIRSTGKKRKLYKYKNDFNFKHLRKTFVTHYARGKNKDGKRRGLVQASLRMRHSSPKVTQDHYFTEEADVLRVDHMYQDGAAPVIPFNKKEQK
jgi:hypothetical protein